MIGTGEQTGAGGIVNAFASGKGAAFGLAWKVRCQASLSDRWQVLDGGRRVPSRPARLAIEAARLAVHDAGKRARLRLRIESKIPSERGLKSSSAVSLAAAKATYDLLGVETSEVGLLHIAVEAGLRSGVSRTGGFDDAAACLLGGIVATDNHARRIAARLPAPSAMWAFVNVPRRRLNTGSLGRRSFASASKAASAAWRLTIDGKLREAMLVNTMAYAPLLGHEPEFTWAALEAGAFAAGLSGKGPAEVALVAEREAKRFGARFPAARRVALNPSRSAR